MLHEEAMRVNRMCRELRKKDVLQDVLRLAHDRSLNKYASIDEEDDFQVSVSQPCPKISTYETKRTKSKSDIFCFFHRCFK